jgi:ribosomal protein S18 acetylase RimI-like enzyme
MEISYRLGDKKDIDMVISFIEKRTSFPGYIGYERPEVVRPIIARSYRAHKSLLDIQALCPLMIASRSDTDEPLGYMIMLMVSEESITAEPQSVIYDFYVEPGNDYEEIMDRFLEQAEKWTRSINIQFLALEIQIAQKHREDYFASRGFSVDMNRIARKIETHTFENTPRQNRFKVRPAVESDRLFILLLNAQNSSFLIPAGRGTPVKDVQNYYFETYSNLTIIDNPIMSILIAEEIETMKPAGYIMLKVAAVDAVSEKPLAYIYDLSVHRDYWGKFVAQRLVREGENLLVKRGVHYLIGDTSESNPRPLKTALKTLGFKLYSRRWVKKLSCSITAEPQPGIALALEKEEIQRE